MTKIVLAVAVASFALAACGDSKPPAKPPAPAATPAPTAPATPAPSTDAKKDEKK